jgi:hypothetical protein
MTDDAMIRATLARMRYDLGELLRFIPQERLPEELKEIRRLIFELQQRVEK